ncbi:ankyrin repeat domain-containing protein [Chelonobacter oris]|uniref:ankyrin repeat domain-containing protein n=1 Tax=Chelonobacter oris TaxID=505317 RepID=UPI001F22007F|nr:ankyrin repeat domain-containing protein [Chelonobacter oris]
MEFYIKHGVDVNAQDMYGMTPLHYALRARNAEGAIALLNAGAGGSAVKLQSAVNVAKMQTRDIAARTQYNLINQFREQFNNSKIHPRDMKLSVDGKIFYADKKLSEGAPIFSGLSNKQIEQLFKDISGINKLPKGKIIAGKQSLNGDVGLVYSIKISNGDLKGSIIGLSNFSSSQEISEAKWTLDVTTPLINKGRQIEVKFK